MSTIIHKQLATKQDLALGKGSVTQERNGNLVSLDLIDFINDQELAELTGLNFSTVSSMVENTTGVVYKIGMSLTVQGENDQINDYVVVSEKTDIALSGGLYAKHLATTSSSLETALEEEIQARQAADANLHDRISNELYATSSSLETALEEETQARQAADANLQNQISGGTPLEASAFSEISWHGQTIENSVTIPDNVNAWSFGPVITIAAGQQVTVGQNSFWTIANGEVSQ